MLGKIEGKRRRGKQRLRWSDSITNSMDMNLIKLGDSGGQRNLAGYSPWGQKELDTTEQLNNRQQHDYENEAREDLGITFKRICSYHFDL